MQIFFPLLDISHSYQNWIVIVVNLLINILSIAIAMLMTFKIIAISIEMPNTVTYVFVC